MSIITEGLPDGVYDSFGNFYQLNTNFRVWIKFEELLEELREKSMDAFVKACDICFYRGINGQIHSLPPTWLETIRVLFAFYCGYKSTEELNTKNDNKSDNDDEDEEADDIREKQIFSYEHDGDYIYAAFVQQYKIDLADCDLHWWKFKALFAGLTSETKIREIMEIRATDISNIKDKERRAHIMRLQDVYSLPDMRSEEEKENDFAAVFW